MICSVEFVFETCENRRHKSTVCFNLTDRKANKYNISYKKFTYFISQHKNYQTNIYNDLPYKKKTILFHTETTWEKTIVIINELLRQFRYNLLAHNYEVWWWEDVVWARLHKFLGLEEALEMPHLPDSHDEQDTELCERPPEHSLVCTFTRHSETLFSIL